MKKTYLYIIASLFISILIYSCGGSEASNNLTPEEAGKQVGLKNCECSKNNTQRENILFIQEYTKILAKLKSGEINNSESYIKAITAITEQDKKMSQQNVDTACYRELSELRKKYELRFLKDVDRSTMHNAEQTYYNQCELKVQNAQKELSEQRLKLVREASSLGDKLLFR